MKNLRNTIKALLATPFALGLPIGSAVAAPQYVLTDLGTLGGQFGQASAINESGLVVGYSHLVSNTALQAFLWKDGAALQNLNTLGGSNAMALGINNTGKIVGNSNLTGDASVHGFVWSLGSMVNLPTLGGDFSQATAINDNGAVAGNASLVGNTASHGVVWQSPPASPTDLGTFGGPYSQANDINLSGQVVGSAENPNRVSHATLWSPPYTAASMRDLGTLGGTFSEARAINASGLVTGVSTNAGDNQFRGFIWQPGTGMVDLGSLAENSSHTAGYDINSIGDVVGFSTTTGGVSKRAVVRKNGATLVDLNGLILPNTGWLLTEARSINDTGEIVGVGTLTVLDQVNNVNKVEPHGFLLTPDTVAPTISCPGPVSTTGAQPLTIGQATAIDNLDPAPTISDNRPASFPGGATTVTWSATDASNNIATCSQLVTLGGDKTPPIVNFTITPSAPSASGWYLVSPSVTWTSSDAESAITSPACPNVAAAPNTTPAGETYSCSATSAGGTTGPVATPVLKVDTLAPVLVNMPVAFNQQATSTTGAVVSYVGPTATDAHSGVAPAGVSCAPASGSAFPMGATTVSCSVNDNAGNNSTASFVVTVADTTAPVVSFNINPATPSATGWYRVSPSTSWTVTDAESPTITRTGCGTSAAQANTGAAGRTLSCTATSAGGTAGPITQNIKVDTVAPTLTGVPANITQTTANATGATVTYVAPTASDALPGSGLSGAASCLPASGSTFPVGATTVNCSASDVAGNTANASFTVTVNKTDSSAPVVNFTVSPAAPSATGWYRVSPSVTWNVSDPESAITSAPCTNVASVGNTIGQTFSCTATSAGGTTGPISTSLIKVDTSGPVFTAIPTAFTVAATGSTGAAVTYTPPLASDSVSGVSATGAGVSCLPASGSTMPIGNTTVNCSVSDIAGNVSTASFVVTVADQTAPVFTSCPATVNLTQGQALPQLTATDNASTPVITRSPAGVLGLGTTAVTWTATDGAGLSATCLQQVTVNAATTETINVTRAQCKRINATSGEWLVQGSSSITANNTIQLYATATVPADLASKLGGVLTVSARGNWQYNVKNGPACITPISLRSSATSTERSNIAINVQ